MRGGWRGRQLVSLYVQPGSLDEPLGQTQSCVLVSPQLDIVTMIIKLIPRTLRRVRLHYRKFKIYIKDTV